MTQIAIINDYADVARACAEWSRLPADVDLDIYNDHLSDEAEIAARLEPYEVVVAIRERTPITQSLLDRLPNLKLLVTPGMRNAAIDLAGCAQAGITVCGTNPGRPATAELAWLLILALTKKLIPEERGVRHGHWGVSMGIGLGGRTLGLLGLGKLGAKVAEVAQVFDMNVLAWSPNLTDQRAAECGVRRVEFDQLLAESDVVSVHLVLGPRSEGLIGARELALMKPDSYLINTARGPIVDEGALINALREGRIGGAGLDVFDVEPLPLDHPFRTLDKVVITPHLGGFVEDSYKIWFPEVLEDIEAWLRGQPVRVIS